MLLFKFVGYDLHLLDSFDEMVESITYSDCFQEFYSMSKLIPLGMTVLVGR